MGHEKTSQSGVILGRVACWSADWVHRVGKQHHEMALWLRTCFARPKISTHDMHSSRLLVL